MILARMAIAGAALSLAACGGSSTSSGGRNFGELAFKYDTLLNEVRNGAPTSATALPSTGSATYRGAMSVFPAAGLSGGVVGAAEVDVDFAAATASGAVNNFFDINKVATEGSLTIERGAIRSRFGRAVGFARISGAVTLPAEGSVSINGGLSLDFFRDNGDILVGRGVYSGIASGGVRVPLTGVLLTDR